MGLGITNIQKIKHFLLLWQWHIGYPAQSLVPFSECQPAVDATWHLFCATATIPNSTPSFSSSYHTMKCLGCKGIFKNEHGLICHLSKKPLYQNAMGIVVPPIQTFVLDSPPVKRHHKKKGPAPPQLPNGLEFPTSSSKGRKTSPTSSSEVQNDSSLEIIF